MHTSARIRQETRANTVCTSFFVHNGGVVLQKWQERMEIWVSTRFSVRQLFPSLVPCVCIILFGAVLDSQLGLCVYCSARTFCCVMKMSAVWDITCHALLSAGWVLQP